MRMMKNKLIYIHKMKKLRRIKVLKIGNNIKQLKDKGLVSVWINYWLTVQNYQLIQMKKVCLAGMKLLKLKVKVIIIFQKIKKLNIMIILLKH